MIKVKKENYTNLQIMKSFDEKNLPDLPEVLLGALELFIKEGLPKIEFKNFKRPLIIGSGNAIVTGEVLFEDKDAIFADENSYKEALKKNIDGVFLFSASCGKHAPIIAKEVLKQKKQIQLITCTKNSQAEEVVGEKNTIITSKNREHYTYNTSTYLGWILAKTREDPKKIKEWIEKKVKPKIPKNLINYNWFLLITPNNLAGLNQLFIVKFIELFGRKIARDVKSFEETRHTITVVPSKSELCSQCGEGKVDFENNILKIPIPKNCDKGMLMSIVYYTIGQIQKQNPPYFKNNISNYINRNNKGDFGKALNVIVE